MREIREPDECETMAEVRAGVDDVDRRIVDLIARRFGYMDAAARIKPDRASVRDEARKAEVIANVKAEAGAFGLDEQQIARLYDQLIEISISYEMDEFEKLKG